MRYEEIHCNCRGYYTWCYREEKTEKKRSVYLPLCCVPPPETGAIYVFGSYGVTGHYTKYSYQREIIRVSKILGMKPVVNSHSVRKSYACLKYQKYRSIAKVQKILNHDNVSTTLAYLTDVLVL
ncbi:hypothetical protein FACS1894132_06560 [Clostridia bacterium]|nr:hypothetical protein FACS1894132_06560 [Clostridia bacterium]